MLTGLKKHVKYCKLSDTKEPFYITSHSELTLFHFKSLKYTYEENILHLLNTHIFTHKS